MLQNLKDVAVILSAFLVISIFIYSININNIIDSFKGLNKSNNKPITLMAILFIFMGLFYGLFFYSIFIFKDSNIIRKDNNSMEYFLNCLGMLIYFALFFIVFCIINGKYFKKYNTIMFTQKEVEIKKQWYSNLNIIFLVVSGVVFMFSLCLNIQKDLTPIIILICIGYFITIYLSGMIMSIHRISNLRKYKIYVAKPENFDGQKYIVGYLICEDNEEYIIRLENEPAIRIKKSLVDMIQPVIDETEDKKVKQIKDIDTAKEEVAAGSEKSISNKSKKNNISLIIMKLSRYVTVRAHLYMRKNIKIIEKIISDESNKFNTSRLLAQKILDDKLDQSGSSRSGNRIIQTESTFSKMFLEYIKYTINKISTTFQNLNLKMSEYEINKAIELINLNGIALLDNFERELKKLYTELDSNPETILITNCIKGNLDKELEMFKTIETNRKDPKSITFQLIANWIAFISLIVGIGALIVGVVALNT